MRPLETADISNRRGEFFVSSRGAFFSLSLVSKVSEGTESRHTATFAASTGMAHLIVLILRAAISIDRYVELRMNAFPLLYHRGRKCGVYSVVTLSVYTAHACEYSSVGIILLPTSFPGCVCRRECLFLDSSGDIFAVSFPVSSFFSLSLTIGYPLFFTTSKQTPQDRKAVGFHRSLERKER